MSDINQRLAAMNEAQRRLFELKRKELQNRERRAGEPKIEPLPGTHSVQLSLCFFSSSESRRPALEYQQILEIARFADQRGFTAIWLPERHFNSFGALMPNPAILAAAMASVTSRIRLRAGSVVLPLHDCLQVAENWAMVDQLSGGRADLSLASGWAKNDFALNPDRYAQRHQHLAIQLDELRRLLQGQRVQRLNGEQQLVMLRSYPPAIQCGADMWLTVSGTRRESVMFAAQNNLHLFSSFIEQNQAQLIENISAYRSAHKQPEQAQVCMALHTYLASSDEAAREQSRQAFKAYITSFVGIQNQAASEQMEEQEREELLEVIYRRYLDGMSLIGSSDTGRRLLGHLGELGVTEVACMIDFGLEHEQIMQSLELLAELISSP
ncbi:MAG: MupA/Atu3671 family FMN-dependent luciferase-like monooxygenase [Pseudomonas sp.]